MTNNEYKARLKNGFDLASAGYDHRALRFFDHSADVIMQALNLRGDEHLLDVCTGTGKVALRAAEILMKGQVVGIDLSQGMLDQAQKKAHDAKINNIKFVCRDADNLLLAENSFDCAACGFGVFFWPDMIKGLRGIHHVLKDNAPIVITSFYEGSFVPIVDICIKLFQDYDVPMEDDFSAKRLDHPDKHKDVLSQSGFDNIQSTCQQVGFYLTDSEEYWSLIEYTGFREFFEHIPFAQRQDFKEAYLNQVNSLADDKGVWLNVQVICSLAYKSNISGSS